MHKSPHIRNRKHLDWLKTLICVKCGGMPCDPAHVVKEKHGSKAMKTGDNQAVPLCRMHHSEQHRVGHARFWGDKRVYVIDLAQNLYTVSGDDEAGIRMIVRYNDHV